jgi:hypothetical protein
MTDILNLALPYFGLIFIGVVDQTGRLVFPQHQAMRR